MLSIVSSIAIALLIEGSILKIYRSRLLSLTMATNDIWAFKQKYGCDPLFYAPFTYRLYDYCIYVEKAVESSGSFDGGAIAGYLKKNGYEGISGRRIFTKRYPLHGEDYITIMAL